jgi:lipopolysaccharide transport system ATP-binding protein
MSEYAIQAEGLSKHYRISHAVQRNNSRKTLSQTLATPFRYLLDNVRDPSTSETLWALKDVSFDVRQGEVVGLIGRNGAGKSTLLKILARITDPSSGHARINGRIGSLLEVGTGFHPELSGRENIFLNGAILGMKKAEINAKFDEIVAFAEVGKFIDTPVKRYSSGMYVRLAFSVAAHLEPKILLVDEVLAVGDLAFQQKCLGRIRSLTTGGMTVLLVSHNMAAIQSSCTRAVFLDRGSVVCQGDTQETINAFQAAVLPNVNALESQTDVGESGVSISGFEMIGEDGVPRREYRFGEPVRIRIELNAHKRLEHPMINFGIRRGDGVVVCNFNNWYDNFKIDYIEGACTLEGWLPPLRLVPDFYEAHILVWHWGGGHLSGDVTKSRPLAWSTSGGFRITGTGLNSHDGVFQVPSTKWRFQRDGRTVDHDRIGPDTIHEVLN